jgi:hypothetical protein
MGVMTIKMKRNDTCSSGWAAATMAQVAGFDNITGDADAGDGDDDHFMRDMQSNRKDAVKLVLAVLPSGVALIAS